MHEQLAALSQGPIVKTKKKKERKDKKEKKKRVRHSDPPVSDSQGEEPPSLPVTPAALLEAASHMILLLCR